MVLYKLLFGYELRTYNDVYSAIFSMPIMQLQLIVVQLFNSFYNNQLKRHIDCAKHIFYQTLRVYINSSDYSKRQTKTNNIECSAMNSIISSNGYY